MFITFSEGSERTEIVGGEEVTWCGCSSRGELFLGPCNYINSELTWLSSKIVSGFRRLWPSLLSPFSSLTRFHYHNLDADWESLWCEESIFSSRQLQRWWRALQGKTLPSAVKNEKITWLLTDDVYERRDYVRTDTDDNLMKVFARDFEIFSSEQLSLLHRIVLGRPRLERIILMMPHGSSWLKLWH